MTLAVIRAALAAHTPQIYPRDDYPDYTHASVALLLRDRITSYNVCYTKLLRHPFDHPLGDDFLLFPVEELIFDRGTATVKSQYIHALEPP